MQNVGTWNSDLALIFFGMLMLPILMYFCAGVFFKCKTVYITEPPEVIYKDRPAKTIYKQSPPKIVYRDRPKKKKKKKKKKPVAPKVVDPIEQDGIDALVSMGTKKMQAKKIIQSLCAKKHYNSLDSLLRDAFSA